MTWQLITIPFSHFCEKARWALDISGLPYVERPYLPGLHLLGTKLRGRGRSVPVLVADDKLLTDSTTILKFLDARTVGATKLYPDGAETAAEVEELEQWLGKKLGPAVRLFAYHHLLPDPARLLSLVGESFSPPGRLALRAVLPFVGPVIRKSYRIDDGRAAQARNTILEVFARTDGMLADGREYLVAGRFTAADLTLAALAAPVLAWPEMPYRRGKSGPTTTRDLIDTMPEALSALAKELRSTPTGKLCRELYRKRRRNTSRTLI